MTTKPSQLDLAALENGMEGLSIRRAVLAHAVAYIVTHGDDDGECDFCRNDFCNYVLSTKIDGPYGGFFEGETFAPAFLSDGIKRCQEAGFFDVAPEGLARLNVANIEAAIKAATGSPVAQAA